MTAFQFQPHKIQTNLIYHYLKTNLDGSYPERVSIFVATPDRIESYKFHPGGSPAGLVFATMDWEIFSATMLESWQVFANGERIFVARMVYMPSEKVVEVEIPMIRPGVDRVPIPHLPFHMYNFDLASLNFAFRHLADPERPLTIGIIDPTFQPEGPTVAYRGEADIRYLGEERRRGANCRKFAIGGAGLDHRGGTIWVDKQGEHFVDIEIDLSDNPNWESFKFVLQGIEEMTEEGWKEFIARQLLDSGMK